MMLLLQGLRPQGRGERAWVVALSFSSPQRLRQLLQHPFLPIQKPNGNEFAVQCIIQLAKNPSLFRIFIHKKAIDIAK